MFQASILTQQCEQLYECARLQVYLLLYNKLQNPVFNYRIEYIIEIKT